MPFPPLEEILDAASAANITPTELRLGANQMREFAEWAARSGLWSGRASSSADGPHEYDGIPVVEVAKDNRRSYLDGKGHEVILD